MDHDSSTEISKQFSLYFDFSQDMGDYMCLQPILREDCSVLNVTPFVLVEVYRHIQKFFQSLPSEWAN